MIKPIDLKIKNIVLADFGGDMKDLREVIVYAIAESGAVNCQQVERPMRGIDEHYDEHLYGVPLTDEWLRRLDFDYCTDEEYPELPGYFYKQFKNDGFLASKDNEGNIFVHHLYDDKMKFYFVHELQNIYYEFYKKELIIKPKV